MRVRWFEPGDDLETAHLLATIDAIERWGQEFARRQREAGFQWVEPVRSQLQRIDSGLGLELWDEPSQRTAFVLPLAGPALLPLAELVVERANASWPWSFEVRRPACSLERALGVVREETGYDLRHARARVGVGRGHLLQVVLASEGFGGEAEEAGCDAAERLVELLLGDAEFDDWIEQVLAVNAPRPSPLRLVGQEQAALPLALPELLPAVHRARAAIRAELAAQPCHRHCERAEWVLFEVSAWRGDEAPAELPQPDLELATTMCPEMLKCHLSGSPFASRRFSRHSEHFCYLQIELEGTREQRVERRVQLEEVLDRALVPGALGCVVGAGVGSRYSYIDLALTQLDAAIEVVRSRLRREQAPARSWLLFCDSHWQNEWVGIYPDTPAPEWAAVHGSLMPDLLD